MQKFPEIQKETPKLDVIYPLLRDGVGAEPVRLYPRFAPGVDHTLADIARQKEAGWL